MGMDIKKGKAPGFFAFQVAVMPPAMVAPDRETPGKSARI
jgi:hypothetical protein